MRKGRLTMGSLQRSVSFIEILIGFVILVTMFFALSRFFTGSGKVHVVTKEFYQAVQMAKRIVEIARATPFEKLAEDDQSKDDEKKKTFEYDLNNDLPKDDKIATRSILNGITYDCNGTLGTVKDINSLKSECKVFHLTISWEDSKNKKNIYEIDTVIARVE
ncbi:hypothetical protein ACFL35_06605 [Candidatus Riflebacteria bacterium]